MKNDLTLKAAALQLGFVTEDEFDSIMDPARMVEPYVATGGQAYPISKDRKPRGPGGT